MGTRITYFDMSHQILTRRIVNMRNNRNEVVDYEPISFLEKYFVSLLKLLLNENLSIRVSLINSAGNLMRSFHKSTQIKIHYSLP